MATVAISLLGAFRAQQDGRPLNAFGYDKVRGLLAYLAVEADLPHRREVLAGLFWPELSGRAAHQNLSQALFKLREAIGDHQAHPPYLVITPQTLQFNMQADYELDVAVFLGHLARCRAHDHRPADTCDLCLAELDAAVALYRGEFLAGFSLDDSPAFDEWCLLTREQLGRMNLEALRQLTTARSARNEYGRALGHTWRRVELDPWQEDAQRDLMRLLVLNGQREAALAQYQTCRSMLADDLGVEPAGETTLLYEQIRAGALAEPARAPSADAAADQPVPLVLLSSAHATEVARPKEPFVARELEIALLAQALTLAVSGQGRMVLIAGGAGRGKTALLKELAQRGQDAYPDLMVAWGNGNAHTGPGDPFLPFREIIELLTGDVESRYAAGSLGRENATRLWSLLPISAQAILEHGPELIGTFLAGPALARRAVTYARPGDTWAIRLAQLANGAGGEDLTTAPGSGPRSLQDALLDQYVRVLAAVARQKPLMILLDDLQWADTGSTGLLFHLGRRLADQRILLVGAYRPSELAAGRGGERHPLEPVLNELRRTLGDIEIDLARSDGRGFVDAYLDTRPNCLGEGFRQTLYRQTLGNPLFTIELLRDMQARGDLVQDANGRWIEGRALDWERLPARVEAVISERIAQLPIRLREVLSVASVEGATFTAEALARVLDANERELVKLLSGELDRKYRLVSSQHIERLGEQRMSHYQFRHILYQRYLYHALSGPERVYLHEAVATALEALHGEAAGEIAVQLARHYQEAGMIYQAVDYLRRAGDRAAAMSALDEAIAHYRQGLLLLDSQPALADAAQLELPLQTGLGLALQARVGYAAAEVGRAYARARELCAQQENSPHLAPVLGLLAMYYGGHGEHRAALEIGQRLLALALLSQDPLSIALGRWYVGTELFFVGRMVEALSHLERVLESCEPERHPELALRHGLDPGVMSLSVKSWLLWAMGHPEPALDCSRRALRLAERLEHPPSLALAYQYAAIVQMFRRDARATLDLAQASVRHCTRHGLSYWMTGAQIVGGWARVRLGQHAEGEAVVREGLRGLSESGAVVFAPLGLVVLAEVCGLASRPADGLDAVRRSLAIVVRNGEGIYEAEAYRVRGDLLAAQLAVSQATGVGARDLQGAAEASFRQALAVARRQSAWWWELRAATGLLRLQQVCGSATEEARQLLEQALARLDAGDETLDVREARGVLARG